MYLRPCHDPERFHLLVDMRNEISRKSRFLSPIITVTKTTDHIQREFVSARSYEPVAGAPAVVAAVVETESLVPGAYLHLPQVASRL
jgi:hypothetical protein